MIISQNIPLAPYTSFGIGGKADFMAQPQTIEDLHDIREWLRLHPLPYYILGDGTNVLFSSQGYRGLIIKPNFNTFIIDGHSITAGSSFPLQELLNRSLAAGLTGLEFMAGIPGSLGGAIYGNAGTYGRSMSHVLRAVTYFNLQNGQEQTREASTITFGYRHSEFKTMPNCLIISAEIQAENGDVEQSRGIIQNWLDRRYAHHPSEPSAGCAFKNIVLTPELESACHTLGLDIEQFKKHQKIPTAFLIDQLDLKGKRIGDAEVSPKHANYIINRGSATAEDVITLMSLIKQQIRDSFGIQLQEEVQIVDAA